MNDNLLAVLLILIVLLFLEIIYLLFQRKYYFGLYMIYKNKYCESQKTNKIIENELNSQIKFVEKCKLGFHNDIKHICNNVNIKGDF